MGIEWGEFGRFEQNGLIVVLSRATIARDRHIYNFTVGLVREDGSRSPFIPIRKIREEARCDLELDYTTILARLIERAQNAAHADMVYDWDRRIDSQQLHERRGMDDGNKTTRITGKTARKRAARKAKAEAG